VPTPDPARAKRRTDDPGLAIERTALAWNRTSLGLAANAALLLRLGLEADEPLLAGASSAIVAAAAAAAWTYGRLSAGRNRRAFQGARPVARVRALRAIAVATAITAVAGTALGLLFAFRA
jgi:uncharacterized membrane protein YidH (DUF202 family)